MYASECVEAISVKLLADTAIHHSAIYADFYPCFTWGETQINRVVGRIGYHWSNHCASVSWSSVYSTDNG
jgi:hypothetical protein